MNRQTLFQGRLSWEFQVEIELLLTPPRRLPGSPGPPPESMTMPVQPAKRPAMPRISTGLWVMEHLPPHDAYHVAHRCIML